LVSDCRESKNFRVHRLVAMTFIHNDDNEKTMVNHINENKFNNIVDNLEWVTPSGNSLHSLAKKVQQIDIHTNNVLNTFNSITAAFKSLNKNIKAIHGGLVGHVQVSNKLHMVSDGNI